MKKLLSFFILIIVFENVRSQKISGVINSEKGDRLPYATITIKGTSKGVTANNKGEYELKVNEGNYKIVCQSIGFETQEKEVFCNNSMVVNFTLKMQNLLMPEVIVDPNAENPAYEIIRQAIKKRRVYENQVNAFKCDLYTKDVVKIRSLPEKIMGQKVPEEDKKTMQLDSSGKGIIYLSEAISKVYGQSPDKLKIEVNSSRLSGSNGFGFTFPTFINFYNNNVAVFEGSSNSRGYVSPIAEGALHYYKYKMLGTFQEGEKTINSIKVIPRRKFEPLFSGVINIVEGDWSIHSCELFLTKGSQLELIDTLSITQLQVPVGNDIVRVKNQVLLFNVNFMGIDAAGSFLTVYSNYVINPVFDKKFFDKIVIKYDSAVSKKTKDFWELARPLPLENEEVLDYKIKDSLFKVRSDSAFTKENIDSLKKKQGKIKIQKVFWSGIQRTHYSTRGNYEWGIDKLVSQLQFNSAEGINTTLSGYFKKRIRSLGGDLLMKPNFRYALSNAHFNAWVDVSLLKKENEKEGLVKKFDWYFSAGKKVSQYNNDYPMNPFANTINTLLYGKNLMKTYEKYFVGFAVDKKYESGLKYIVKVIYEDRLPIFNTTKFTFYSKDSINITENFPIEKMSINQLVRHQAVVASFSLSFQPGQKYIQFPKSKVSLGSKYPTFSFSYTKGINNLLGSDVDFDKWSFGFYDDKNLKLLGLFKYKFLVGGFLNTKNLYLQDYKHFSSNTLVANSAYLNGFQLMRPFVNSNTAALYGEAHIEHHFNGLLTNKIPVIKKLQWNLLTGGNAYFINETDNYAEYFIGLENIFKIFRVDFVTAFNNGKYYRSSFVLGTGGFIGEGLSNSVSMGKIGVVNF